MKKFQIGKLTLKNFLLHWGVAILITSCDIFSKDFKLDLIDIFVLSIFPGLLSSILLIASIKEFLKAIKKKNYLAIIGMIIFVFFYTKYFYKL